jgi:predicted nucleotide-binding protein
VARINPKLLKALETKTGLSPSQIYRQIERVVRDRSLPRHLAAIAVAADHRLNISRYASAEDLAEIRRAAPSEPPVRSVVVPGPTTDAARPALAPRGRRARARRARPAARETRRGTSVWVVYGRNESLRRAMFAFLRSLGLQPIEWGKAIALTGKGSPYVGEVLDRAFHEAAAVVVLLSPDDEARLAKEFVKSSDPAYEKNLSRQARPNVLFEAGMAFGKNPDSTILVQVGKTRPFSDVGGRHIVHLDNTPERRNELITRLANAGCNVDTSGNDYLREGDFTV